MDLSTWCEICGRFHIEFLRSSNDLDTEQILWRSRYLFHVKRFSLGSACAIMRNPHGRHSKDARSSINESFSLAQTMDAPRPQRQHKQRCCWHTCVTINICAQIAQLAAATAWQSCAASGTAHNAHLHACFPNKYARHKV